MFEFGALCTCCKYVISDVCVIGFHVYFVADTAVLLEINKVSPGKQVPRIDSLRMSLEQLAFSPSYFRLVYPFCLYGCW
jgi:hypothetical protein